MTDSPPGGDFLGGIDSSLPIGRIAGARDFEEVLVELREMIETARMMPMSASVLVNRDEALSLIEDALGLLPEELRRARWLLKERDEFLAQAKRDGDDLIESARVQAARMVERTEIAREARRTAQQVVGDAEADARRLRHEAEDFIDARLAAFEAVLGRTLESVHKGRERLQVDLGPLDLDDEDDETEADGPEIFDQDQR
jgi:cell division septum initiation protein DivIVA